MNATEMKYSCPMHQEIQGNLNDRCSLCGMLLTIPVGDIAERFNFKTINSNKLMLNYNKNITLKTIG